MTSSDQDLRDARAGHERPEMRRRLVMSDVHGHVDDLKARLQEHGLTDAEQEWTGGAAALWFLGDYVDRGRRGLEVIDVVRRLERDATEHKGRVQSLLGNHELQFLAALHFGDRSPAFGGGTTWRAGWLRYGGIEEELRDVDDATVDWMTCLPLGDLDGDDLLIHSDTDAYLQLGGSVEEINAAGREILTNRDPGDWAMLHHVLTQRHGFRGSNSPRRLLDALGARRVVHGHSSLIGSFGLTAEEARVPHVYASGRAVAVDGGVFEGGSLLVALI